MDTKKLIYIKSFMNSHQYCPGLMLKKKIVFFILLMVFMYLNIKFPFWHYIEINGIEKIETENNNTDKAAREQNIHVYVNVNKKMQTEKVNCSEFIHSNLNTQVTYTLLQTLKLFIVCKQNENKTFNEIIYDIVGGLQCDPHATLSTIKRPLIALASFPGSGNTMTRRIVEILTGTTTAYSDKIVNCTSSKGSRYIIKTHAMQFKPSDKECQSHEYVKAIYIIRNPFKAIYAEYNRLLASLNRQKTFLSKGIYFGNTWKKFVISQADLWKDVTVFWLKKFKHPVHILVYKHIRGNRIDEALKLSTFLQVNSTLKMLCCTFSQYVEEKKRSYPHSLTSKTLYDIYDKTQIAHINRAIFQTLRITHLNVLRDYILPYQQHDDSVDLHINTTVKS